VGILLFVLFVVVPIAELAVIIAVGQQIGVLWTVALLLASAVIGSWLLRREGRRTWRALQEALAAGRVPTREVADGALVLVGAALMVAPGFITDIAGMLCLIPATRSMLRGVLATAAVRRLLLGRVRSRRGAGQPWVSPGRGDQPPEPRPRIIDGEVE
jgi:UPF0716 protein FxsA